MKWYIYQLTKHKRKTGYIHVPNTNKSLSLAAVNPQIYNKGIPLSLPQTENNKLSKIWLPGPVLDQEATSACTAFATIQYLQTEPKCKFFSEPVMAALAAYAEFQILDDDHLPGKEPEVQGSTLLAATRWLAQNHYTQSTPVWMGTASELWNYILTTGPVLVGTPWWSGMQQPDPQTGQGKIKGKNYGGHAYLLYGVKGYSNKISEAEFWFVNSHGKNFGIMGTFWMTGMDVDRLLQNGKTGHGCALI